MRNEDKINIDREKRNIFSQERDTYDNLAASESMAREANHHWESHLNHIAEHGNY